MGLWNHILSISAYVVQFLAFDHLHAVRFHWFFPAKQLKKSMVSEAKVGIMAP
jgi:hypothetical protein